MHRAVFDQNDVGEGVGTLQTHLKDVAVISQPVPPAAEPEIREGQTVSILEDIEAEFLLECLQTVAGLDNDEAGNAYKVTAKLVATVYEQPF